MRTLATLQEADSGEATLDDGKGGSIDVLRDKDAVRRQLGYLPQDFGVYPKVSALGSAGTLRRAQGLTDRKQRREVVDGLLAAGESVGCAQTQARRFFRRHAPALRHRPGAARQSASGDRR
jgi:ABC-type multidrug transport system ATPase subunit